MVSETEEDIRSKRRKPKIEKDGNDSLSIEHKEQMHIYSISKSMGLLTSSILNNNNNNHNYRYKFVTPLIIRSWMNADPVERSQIPPPSDMEPVPHSVVRIQSPLP